MRLHHDRHVLLGLDDDGAGVCRHGQDQQQQQREGDECRPPCNCTMSD
jgi:hypothetical protein